MTVFYGRIELCYCSMVGAELDFKPSFKSFNDRLRASNTNVSSISGKLL